MGRSEVSALTTRQAKRRLRETARQVDPCAWVRSHPYGSLAESFLLGVALASEPRVRDLVLRLLLC